MGWTMEILPRRPPATLPSGTSLFPVTCFPLLGLKRRAPAVWQVPMILPARAPASVAGLEPPEFFESVWTLKTVYEQEGGKGAPPGSASQGSPPPHAATGRSRANPPALTPKQAT